MSSPTTPTTPAGSPVETHDTGTHAQQRPATEVAQRFTKGVITHAEDGVVYFRPLDTSYEHHLEAVSTKIGELGRNVRALIRVRARKVYSVASGGNFVQPILGQPRIIQGRVIALEGSTLFVKANALFAVELPTGVDTIDLANGPIAMNSTVNVVVLPGAAIEIVRT